jgi:hypothetical protein
MIPGITVAPFRSTTEDLATRDRYGLHRPITSIQCADISAKINRIGGCRGLSKQWKEKCRKGESRQCGPCFW